MAPKSNPLQGLFEKGFSQREFALIAHGFVEHGRDYYLVFEDQLETEAGTYQINLTHVVALDYETKVDSETWVKSWSDDFVDFEAWENAGHPDGRLWQSWLLCDPGWKVPDTSEEAERWSRKLNKQMFEASLESDQFIMRFIFHSVRSLKLADTTEILSQIIIPSGDD